MAWTQRSAAVMILRVTQKQRQEMADRVAALMDAQGLTNEALAFKAGVSVATVSRVLNARHTPRLDTIERIARTLEVSESELRGAPLAPLGLADHDGNGTPMLGDDLENRLRDLQDAIEALRVETEARDLEVLQRLDEMRPPPEASLRQRPR